MLLCELLGKFPYYLILRISGTALQGPCIHLPTSTATPTAMADESMVDESMAAEFKVEESMATIQFRGAWHTYISYEILEYRRKRSACHIYGGEILKYPTK